MARANKRITGREGKASKRRRTSAPAIRSQRHCRWEGARIGCLRLTKQAPSEPKSHLFCHGSAVRMDCPGNATSPADCLAMPCYIVQMPLQACDNSRFPQRSGVKACIRVLRPSPSKGRDRRGRQGVSLPGRCPSWQLLCPSWPPGQVLPFTRPGWEGIAGGVASLGS